MSVLAWLDQFISALEPAFLQILNMSITASYVTLAVLLVRLLLRRLPKRYSYALWSVVAFRLVCPVSISSLLSIFNIGIFDMTAATKGAELIYVPGNIGTMQEPSVTVGIPYLNAAITESLPAPTPAASANPLQILQFIGTAVWILGLSALVVYAAVSLVGLYRRVRGAVRMAGTEDVYECDSTHTPFVLGFFRPRIYLPFRLNEAERAHVLAHERFHLRRGDHIVKPLAFLLTAVYWFNPFVWAAYFCMCTDLEMRCDEAVLGMLPAERRADYSMSLLSLSTGRHFALASPLAFGETGVKRRIQNVLSFKKSAAWLAVLATAACVCVAVACATNANDTVAPGKTAEGTLAPVNWELYSFDECLYLSLLSSDSRPITEGVAEFYRIETDRFTILDSQTQEVKQELGKVDWAFEPVDEEAFAALFMPQAPDLSQYETRLQCELGGGYVLYKMDDELWLGKTGTHGGARKGEKYMWSLYRLNKIADLASLSPTGSGLPLPPRQLRAGRYATEDGMAWLDLHEDRTFQFIRNIAMSYAPEGVWACENGVLTLTVSEEETCRFTLEEGGEALRFEAGMGAEEGTIFRYIGPVPARWAWETVISPSEEGVAEFLAAAGTDVMNTGYENDACHNVTPAEVSAVWIDRFQIFKFEKSCASYLLYEGAVYPLGTWFGGIGFTDAAVADLNRDGAEELYFTCSWGSGMHRAQAGCFDPARREVMMFDFAYAHSGQENGGELVLRADGEGIGVFAAELAAKSFVDFTLVPVKEVARIASGEGGVTLTDYTGTAQAQNDSSAWGGMSSRAEWLAAYRAEHAGAGKPLTAKEQAALSELAYYVSTCEPLAPEQTLTMETHVTRAFYVYSWDADQAERYWEPEIGRLPAFGTVLQSEDYINGKNAVVMDVEEAEAFIASVFGRELPEDAADYDDSSFFCTDGTYFQTFGDYGMRFDRFEEIEPLVDGEYYVRYVIGDPMVPGNEEDNVTERMGELIVRRDAESRFGFCVRAVVRTPWEKT